MKKFSGWAIALIIVAVCVLLGFGWYKNTYNSLVNADEAVSAQWAEVQNQYQRRYDLIPNLVSTVKGAAANENKTLTEVTEARAKVGGVVKISDELLSDPEAFERYQKAQDQLGSSLQRLLAVTEAYPELKTNQNFLALQDELEGTENRITVARKRYNDTAKAYNTKIRSFPASIIANNHGFEKKIYFNATAGAENAPKVEF